MNKADKILLLSILGMTLIVLTLKLTIFPTLSWWIVSLPIYAPFMIILLLLITIVIGLLLRSDYDNAKKR